MCSLGIGCTESLGDELFFLLFSQLFLVLVIVKSRCVLNYVTTYLINEVVIGVVLAFVLMEILSDLLPGRTSLPFLSFLKSKNPTPALRGYPSGALGII